MCFGQFNPYILTLEKQVPCVWTLKVPRVEKQPRKRRTSTRRDHVKTFRWSILDARVAHIDGNADPLRRLFQKRAFFPRCFVENRVNLQPVAQKQGQDHSGKTRTASKVHQGFSARGDEIEQLRTVPNMPTPYLGQRVARNEIVPLIPVLQQADEQFQARECFT